MEPLAIFNGALDAPDYINVPHLGSGSMKSTYNVLGQFINQEIAAMTFLKPEGTTVSWAEIIEVNAVDNQSLWFTMLTEYNTTCEGHGQLTKLEGAIRSHPSWHQLILYPQARTHCQTWQYHLSMSDVPISDNYVLIALTVDSYSWCSHSATIEEHLLPERV